MIPSSHYSMLKVAEFTPSAPPTVETMKDSRGHLERNAGTYAATAGELGLALAPFTFGTSLAIGGALAGGGLLWDHFAKRRELARQTEKWRADEQARTAAAVRDGTMYSGRSSYGDSPIGKAMGDAQDASRSLLTPEQKKAIDQANSAPKPAVQVQAAPPAPPVTPKPPVTPQQAYGNLAAPK